MKKTLLISAILVSGIFLAQSFETTANPKVSEIQKNFKFKKYPKKLLSEFSKDIGAEKNEIVTVFEQIPGEIIGWTNHRGSFTTVQNYKIVNNKLVFINTLPKNEKFLENLNKYAPEKSHFEFNSINGRIYEPEIIKKQENGTYLLNANLIASKQSDENSVGIYELEYETADFKNFKPLRIKNSEAKNWTIIK